MAVVTPVLRIFDLPKAIEFYVDWLGFNIDWEHKFGENFPIYIQVSLGDVVIHLSEHHGDCSPGGKVLIQAFPALISYHQLLVTKDYKYNKPGIEKASWNTSLDSMEVVDPFGNRLHFTGA